MAEARRLVSGGRALAVLIAAGLGALGWAAGVEPARLVERHLEVTVAQWPSDHPPMRAVFLTDLHVGAPHVGLDRLREIVGKVEAGKPDLVLLGGDYVIQGVLGGTPVPPEAIAEILGSLRPPLGMVAVLGNHDWWLDGARVSAALAARGVRVLENASLKVGDLWIAGLADDTTRKPDGHTALAAVPVGRISMGGRDRHQYPALALQRPARTGMVHLSPARLTVARRSGQV